MILLINQQHLSISDFAQALAQQLDKPLEEKEIALDQIENYCEQEGVDMLVVSCESNRKAIQQVLDACRTLRIPYIIFTPQMQTEALKKGDAVLIPVSMFEEELSKAQIATAFGRFCHTKSILVQANDYGTRAIKNIGKIRTLIEKFELPYSIEKAQKNSYKVEQEACDKAAEYDAKILVVTASRDYGLDDIIFGPKERHIIQKATIPVLLLNPRGDLYSLCD